MAQFAARPGPSPDAALAISKRAAATLSGIVGAHYDLTAASWNSSNRLRHA